MVDDNWSLAMRYVEGPRGLFAMRYYGFDADGMGMEHDMGYHWNALDPMVRVATALDLVGYDSSGLDLESPLEVPIALTGDPSAFRGGSRYEWGYAHYRNPLFALPSDLVNANGKRSLAGLLYGADHLPPADQGKLPPSHLEAAGYVVLRHRLAGGAIRSIMVNYGSPHHRSHIDRLSVHVSENGRELIGMMGQNSKYGRKGWYSTLADSLLAVNGRDQIIGRGRLLRVEQTDTWAAMAVGTDAATPLYEPDVDYRRLIVSGPDFVLLLDRATAAAPVDFQWAFYPGMALRTPGEWQPCEHPGLDGSRGASGPLSPVRTEWRRGAPAVDLRLVAEVKDETDPMPVQVLAAPPQIPMAFSTPGNQKGGWVDALLMHGVQQREARWAALLSRAGDGTVSVRWGDGGEAVVTASSGTWRIAQAAGDEAWSIEHRAP